MNEEFQSSFVVSLIPDTVLDVDKTLQSLRQSKIERCNATVNLCETHIFELSHLDQRFTGFKKSLSDNCKRLKQEIEDIKQEFSVKQNDLTELQKQVAQMKEVIKENTPCLSNDDELSELVQRVCSLKEKLEGDKKALKHDFETFKKGVAYYNKYLLCNTIFETRKQVIFTPNVSARNASEAHEFIRFTTNDNAITFQYVEMYPKLKAEQSLVKRFNETGNVQGFILSFLKAIKLHKARQILRERN